MKKLEKACTTDGGKEISPVFVEFVRFMFYFIVGFSVVSCLLRLRVHSSHSCQ